MEKRGGNLSITAARGLESEDRDELMKVFVNDDDEPTSLVDVPQTLLYHLGNQRWYSHRLYIVDNGDTALVAKARNEIAKWNS